MGKMILLAVTLIGSATVVAADLQAVLEASMVDKNQATLDRLQRDDVQAACSKPRGESGDPEAEAVIRDAHLAAVSLPGNGEFLGDWETGGQIANNGRGLQSSDDPAQPNGGNCYACHQLDPNEVAYGTIGPSLSGYGTRGQSKAVLEYTWTKLWDTHAYNLCSHMPRFGAQGILTEQQLKDVMAYLLDPESPVNKPIEN